MIYFILIFGLIARLISLNQSLWLDETTTALVARMGLADIFTKFLPGDFHPPLYYLILKYWTSVFGSSEVILRVPSVIFGTLTIYVTYLICKRLADKKTGLVAAVLLATSGLGIYYSQEARMYSLAALLVSLSVYLFLEKRWLPFSFSVVAIGMTDYVSLFILPAFLVYGWKNRRRVFLCFLPLLVSFLVWLPTFRSQLAGGFSQAGNAWWGILGVPTLKNIALIPVKFIFGRISIDDKSLYLSGAIFGLLFFGYLLYLGRKSDKILWYWLSFPILVGILISFMVPTLSYFRLLFCLPAFYILISTGFARAGKYRYILLGLALIVNIASSGYYLLNPRFQREDWRGAAKAVGNTNVVFPATSQKEAFTYYGKGNQIVEASAFSGADNEIWLLRYVWEIVDPADSARLKIESMGYNKTAELNFNGVVFWKYSK